MANIDLPRETGINSDDGSDIPWVNASGVESHDLNDKVALVQRELASWARKAKRNEPSLFNRVAYVSPDNPYAQMATAKSAVSNDDILGGVCDVTEGLALQGIKWESDEPRDTDLFNQMARDLNLDEFARQWHRQEYTYSQVVVGTWWGWKDYKFRGKSESGKKSKSSRRVWVPVAWTMIDPEKVVPLRPGPFGEDRLAWHASKEEMSAATAGFLDDPLMREFTNGIVKITDAEEERLLTSWGIDTKRLLHLNPSSVFRYCRTKATYERFPELRLKSTFPVLDLKQQLLEADRVALVGSINFIILVRQGTDEKPATQDEIDNLKENFKVVAKLPVVVADHRLSIDIITPDQTHVLESKRYDTLDQRLMNRALGAVTLGGARLDNTITLTRGIARLLENRRHMMKRTLEDKIARTVVEHPLNEGKFDGEPNLTFTPRNVSIDADAEMARSIMTLRTQNDLSRESTLEWFGFDQAVEALRRKIEEDEFDDIFKTQVPFSTPNGGNGEPPQVSGGRGGRPAGGGDSPQSPQGQSGGRGSSGQKSPGK